MITEELKEKLTSAMNCGGWGKENLKRALPLIEDHIKQLQLHVVINWVAVEDKEPPFDTKVLTWNNNEPDEPSRTDTLIAIEQNSKGKLYKWLENGNPTHWAILPKQPCL